MPMVRRRKSRGFTLVEVIIVLLILGALAAMAIPRFIMYRMRALRAECKTNITSLMRAETSHLAEHSTYTDNLGRLDWQPDGKPIYIYGFTSDSVPTASAMNDTAELRAAGGGTAFRTHKMIDAFGNPLTSGSLPPATAQVQQLTVGAAANLDRDATLDQWTLDNDGNLINVTDDIEE